MGNLGSQYEVRFRNDSKISARIDGVNIISVHVWRKLEVGVSI